MVEGRKQQNQSKNTAATDRENSEGEKNQSWRGRFLLTFPLAAAASWPSTEAKYSSEPLGSAFIVLSPSFQLAGQTSPCSS